MTCTVGPPAECVWIHIQGMLQHLNQVVIYRCLPLNAMANRPLSIYRDVDFGMFEPQKHLASAVQLAKFDRNETDFRLCAHPGPSQFVPPHSRSNEVTRRCAVRRASLWNLVPQVHATAVSTILTRTSFALAPAEDGHLPATDHIRRRDR